MSSSDMNLMDFLFPREDAFLKGEVKDEPFIDQSYGDDAIAVSSLTHAFISFSSYSASFFSPDDDRLLWNEFSFDSEKNEFLRVWKELDELWTVYFLLRKFCPLMNPLYGTNKKKKQLRIFKYRVDDRKFRSRTEIPYLCNEKAEYENLLECLAS